MSDKKHIDFVKDFGGEYKDPSKFLRNYVDHQNGNRKDVNSLVFKQKKKGELKQ
jgi:hypothetical protein